LASVSIPSRNSFKSSAAFDAASSATYFSPDCGGAFVLAAQVGVNGLNGRIVYNSPARVLSLHLLLARFGQLTQHSDSSQPELA